MFQLEAALRRQKGLMGMDSFGTTLPVNSTLRPAQDGINAVNNGRADSGMLNK